MKGLLVVMSLISSITSHSRRDLLVTSIEPDIRYVINGITILLHCARARTLLKLPPFIYTEYSAH